MCGRKVDISHKQTNKRTNKQTNRQTDRQTDKHGHDGYANYDYLAVLNPKSDKLQTKIGG